jgi:hypothetical protein
MKRKRKQLPKSADLAKVNLRVKEGDVIMIIDTSSSYDHGRIIHIDKILKTKIKTVDEDGDHFHDYKIDEFLKLEFVIITEPIEEFESKILNQAKDLDALLDKAEISDETMLVKASSKQMLKVTESAIIAQQNKFAVVQAVLHRKMEHLRHITHELDVQLKKVHKVLGVVELYLGVHEEVVQIQQGQPTTADCPIHIRQQVLFMDEEFGDPTDGGLDFRQLKQFDKWICDKKNLDRFLPEEKGVVAIRVRRHDKFYVSNPLHNSFMNQQNHKTYLLIRNGQNIYRIWSDIVISPRLFPTKNEFEPEVRHWHDGSEYVSPFEPERIEKVEFEYKKYGLMLQGIMHRTNIFNPIGATIDVFNAETWNNMLVFIRDDEALLPSDRLSWVNWRESINKKIDIGSRVIYRAGYHHYERGYNWMIDRVGYNYQHAPSPNNGLYVVVHGLDGSKDRGKLRFMYNPEDHIWRGIYDENGPRKNRIGFKFYNDEVLNYDQIDLDDIDFYINCRTERHHYLEMMPLLYRIKRERLKELEREKQFVTLIASRNNTIEDKVWKLVEWWKYKNKWKRPVDKDDAKALRMIERKLKKG